MHDLVRRTERLGVPADFDEPQYLHLNKDVANAVSEGHFLSGADHWLQCGRHEARQMRAPKARPSPPESDLKWIGTRVPEGQTRDCLDPWGYMQVRATGEVLPCCAHPPVGILRGDVDLEAVVGGKAVEQLRLGLLVGQLNTYCGRCSIRNPISIVDLRRRYALHQIDWNRLPLDQDRNLILDSNDSIPGWLHFENVEPGRFAFKETITLYATDAPSPPTVVFENATWDDSPMIDLFVIVPAYSGCMTCRISAGPSANELEPICTTTVYRGETLNIVEELPSGFSQGSVAVSAQKYFDDDETRDCVVSLTPPVLRKRVAGC